MALFYVAPVISPVVGIDLLAWINRLHVGAQAAVVMGPLIVSFVAMIWLAPSNRDIDTCVIEESVEDEMNRPFFRTKATLGMDLWRAIPIGDIRRMGDSKRGGAAGQWILQGPDRKTIASVFLRLDTLWRVAGEIQYQGKSYDVARSRRKWGWSKAERVAKRNVLFFADAADVIVAATPDVIQQEHRLRLVLEGQRYLFTFSRASICNYLIAQKSYEATVHCEERLVGYACRDFIHTEKLSNKSLILLARHLSERDKVMLLSVFVCGRYATSPLALGRSA